MNKHFNTSKSSALENEKLIIEFLGKYGPTSRQRICEIIGLSSSTARDTFVRLRKKGLILEKKGVSKTRGQKPIIVDINPEGGHVAGVTMYPNSIFVGLFKLDLEIIENIKICLKESPSPQNICHLLQKHLFTLMNKHHIPKSKLNALGVVMSGLISSEGVVKCSSPFRWKNVPFEKNLSEYFNCPVTIHKITIEDLYPEFKSFPRLWEQKVILYITISYGVGGGLISDNKIVYGGSNHHAEIGHIVVEPDGPSCGCGNRGCLESLISGPALAQRIKNDIKKGAKTILRKLVRDNKLPEYVIEKWGQAIKSKDDYALKLRNFVGENLSRMVSIAINFYDPNVIILSGYVTEQCSSYLIKKIKEKISTEVVDSDNRNIRIVAVSGEEDISYLTKSAAKAALWKLQKS